MDKKIATAEVEYRLAKWIVYNLEQKGDLSSEEAAAIIKLLMDKYNPICSCLESVVMPNE